VSSSAANAVTDLTKDFRRALASPSFTERNALSARVIARESALRARRPELEPVFLEAALEAGAAFRPAFGADGVKLPDAKPLYEQAVEAAGPIAYRHLVAKWPEADSVVASARLGDLARICSSFVSQPLAWSEDELAAAILEVVPTTDYARREAETGLPVRARGERPSPDTGLERLTVGLRLANATWRAGQVHRAAWEGTDDRIDPGKRPVFLPYDAYLRWHYEKLVSDNASRRDADVLAFAGVVFDLYKDLLELRRGRAPTP